MADIAINAITRRVQFTGNTGTGPFAFTFNILESTDLAVYKNDTQLVVTTDYTVSVNSDGTGSVTLVAPVISSDVLTLLGARPLARTTDFVAGGDFFAASVNEQMDSQVIMVQQLDEKLSRTIIANPGDEAASLELPLKADRAGKYLGFNFATGDLEAVQSIAERITISTLSPSGGTDGDLWFKLSS